MKGMLGGNENRDRSHAQKLEISLKIVRKTRQKGGLQFTFTVLVLLSAKTE